MVELLNIDYSSRNIKRVDIEYIGEINGVPTFRELASATHITVKMGFGFNDKDRPPVTLEKLDEE